MAKLKFETYRVADISTAHITREDAELMGKRDCPYHLSELDDGGGSILYVVSNPELKRLKDFGFSKQFMAIFKALAHQKIPYVRFDKDGAEVAGLKKFDW